MDVPKATSRVDMSSAKVTASAAIVYNYSIGIASTFLQHTHLASLFTKTIQNKSYVRISVSKT
jgi:hypothetical protein